jgi:hypothetical protein
MSSISWFAASVNFQLLYWFYSFHSFFFFQASQSLFFDRSYRYDLEDVFVQRCLRSEIRDDFEESRWLRRMILNHQDGDQARQNWEIRESDHYRIIKVD